MCLLNSSELGKTECVYVFVEEPWCVSMFVEQQ